MHPAKKCPSLMSPEFGAKMRVWLGEQGSMPYTKRNYELKTLMAKDFETALAADGKLSIKIGN